MDDKLYDNLVKLLILFKNRPYHLAKYLINNSALDEEFKNKISGSSKIDKVSLSKNFNSISEMEDFFQSLLIKIEGKNNSEVEFELNEKLNTLILSEKYEEAAKLRDYMVRNKIRRIY